MKRSIAFLCLLIVVVLIAVYSSRPRKGVAPPKERVRANLLIAVGVTVKMAVERALAARP